MRKITCMQGPPWRSVPVTEEVTLVKERLNKSGADPGYVKRGAEIQKGGVADITQK